VILDPDEGDVPSAFIDWGLAVSLVDGKYPDFIIKPPIQNLSIGTYPITITLSDNHMPVPTLTYHTFILKIADPLGLLNTKPSPQQPQKSVQVYDAVSSD
jgi:hypothetical protein